MKYNRYCLTSFLGWKEKNGANTFNSFKTLLIVLIACKRAAKPFLSPPLALASPFARGSRVTSPDSPKRRACSEASLLIVLMLCFKNQH